MEKSVAHAAPDDTALDLFGAPVPAVYRASVPGDDYPDETPWRDSGAARLVDVPDLDEEPESAAAAQSYVIPGEPLVEPEAPLSPDQTTLFDMGTLTVVLPDEAIRAQYAAAGETPQARKAVYDSTTIRQIVLRYDAGEYREVLEMLESLMVATGTSTHTAALTQLLREHHTHAA